VKTCSLKNDLLLTYKGVSVCSVSHRKTCLCATCHLHISLWFVQSGMFHANVSTIRHLHSPVRTIRHLHSPVRTLKRRVFTHFWLTRTCLSTAWHLLSHYFDWCERNMGRVHSKRCYADVSAYNFWHTCISVTWPTCLQPTLRYMRYIFLYYEM